MPATKGGSRALLRALRAVMAGPGDGQQRLDKIVRLVASNMVAEVCSIYLKRDELTLELCATQGLRPDSVTVASVVVKSPPVAGGPIVPASMLDPSVPDSSKVFEGSKMAMLPPLKFWKTTLPTVVAFPTRVTSSKINDAVEVKTSDWPARKS